KLRMLRAVRFAARLNFAIEPRTFAAMRTHATQITQVSAERVREELTRILTEGAARRGFELLDASGLLAQVLPEVTRLKGVEQPPQYHPEGDVWIHTLMLLDHLRVPEEDHVPGAKAPRVSEPVMSGLKPGPISEANVISRGSQKVSATLAWGMLLHDIGKPATFTPPDPAKPGDRIRFNGHVEVGVTIARAILNRLRFSNEDCTQIIALVQNHMRFGDILHMRPSTLKRFLRLPKFDEHLALHYADVMSSNRQTELYEFAKRRYEESPPEVIRPALLVTGRELIDAGYRPGPVFKPMLVAAEDEQLEGEVTTREEALAMLRQKFGPPA
ncbi:MAG TPA: HD domain-containing protein, partial [Acidobacteriaceae bacterium]